MRALCRAACRTRPVLTVPLLLPLALFVKRRPCAFSFALRTGWGVSRLRSQAPVRFSWDQTREATGEWWGKFRGGAEQEGDGCVRRVWWFSDDRQRHLPESQLFFAYCFLSLVVCRPCVPERRPFSF